MVSRGSRLKTLQSSFGALVLATCLSAARVTGLIGRGLGHVCSKHDRLFRICSILLIGVLCNVP